MTHAELDLEVADMLPAREEMARIKLNLASVEASNFSLAANVLSKYSVAKSAAVQTITVIQH